MRRHALSRANVVASERQLDQRVQPELPGHGGELPLGGRVQPYPGQPAFSADSLLGFVEGGGLGGSAPVHVDGVVHDHGHIIRRSPSGGQEPEDKSTKATTAARAKR
jgi:hypothetical protein